MRKRSLLLAAGACVATLSLAVSTALADPNGPPPFRALAGVGSGTTSAVTNALSDDIKDGAGTKIIGSYDSEGSPTIQTKATGCTMNRPDGDLPGIDALVANTANGCLQFARTVNDDRSARPGQNLTYIPFGTDVMGYVTRSQTTVSPRLTVAQLKTIYTCGNAAVQPLIPHFGEETREFFLQKLGLANTPNFTTLNPCVKDVVNGAEVEQLQGNVLTLPNQLMPYSVSVWVSQAAGVIPDEHGSTVLRRIDNITPLLPNTDSTLARDVFNVVPNGQIGAGTLTNQVFVGPGSKICTDIATIKKFAIAANPNCGSTAKQTP